MSNHGVDKVTGLQAAQAQRLTKATQPKPRQDRQGPNGDDAGQKQKQSWGQWVKAGASSLAEKALPSVVNASIWVEDKTGFNPLAYALGEGTTASSAKPVASASIVSASQVAQVRRYLNSIASQMATSIIASLDGTATTDEAAAVPAPVLNEAEASAALAILRADGTLDEIADYLTREVNRVGTSDASKAYSTDAAQLEKTLVRPVSRFMGTVSTAKSSWTQAAWSRAKDAVQAGRSAVQKGVGTLASHPVAALALLTAYSLPSSAAQSTTPSGVDAAVTAQCDDLGNALGYTGVCSGDIAAQHLIACLNGTEYGTGDVAKVEAETFGEDMFRFFGHRNENDFITHEQRECFELGSGISLQAVDTTGDSEMDKVSKALWNITVQQGDLAELIAAEDAGYPVASANGLPGRCEAVCDELSTTTTSTTSTNTPGATQGTPPTGAGTTTGESSAAPSQVATHDGTTTLGTSTESGDTPIPGELRHMFHNATIDIPIRFSNGTVITRAVDCAADQYQDGIDAELETVQADGSTGVATIPSGYMLCSGSDFRFASAEETGYVMSFQQGEHSVDVYFTTESDGRIAVGTLRPLDMGSVNIEADNAIVTSIRELFVGLTDDDAQEMLDTIAAGGVKLIQLANSESISLAASGDVDEINLHQAEARAGIDARGTSERLFSCTTILMPNHDIRLANDSLLLAEGKAFDPVRKTAFSDDDPTDCAGAQVIDGEGNTHDCLANGFFLFGSATPLCLPKEDGTPVAYDAKRTIAVHDLVVGNTAADSPGRAFAQEFAPDLAFAPQWITVDQLAGTEASGPKNFSDVIELGDTGLLSPYYNVSNKPTAVRFDPKGNPYVFAGADVVASNVSSSIGASESILGSVDPSSAFFRNANGVIMEAFSNNGSELATVGERFNIAMHTILAEAPLLTVGDGVHTPEVLSAQFLATLAQSELVVDTNGTKCIQLKADNNLADQGVNVSNSTQFLDLWNQFFNLETCDADGNTTTLFDSFATVEEHILSTDGDSEAFDTTVTEWNFLVAFGLTAGTQIISRIARDRFKRDEDNWDEAVDVPREILVSTLLNVGIGTTLWGGIGFLANSHTATWATAGVISALNVVLGLIPETDQRGSWTRDKGDEGDSVLRAKPWDGDLGEGAYIMLIKLREAMKRCCGTSASKCCQPKASVAFAHHHKPAHHSQVELMSPTSRAAAAAHVDAKSDETF